MDPTEKLKKDLITATQILRPFFNHPVLVNKCITSNGLRIPEVFPGEVL